MKKIQINVDAEVYARFKEICKTENIPAAIKLRQFMSDYVKENDLRLDKK